MVDLRPFLEGTAEALRPALKAFFLTAVVMSLVALIVGAASYAIAADGVVLRGALAALVALALCTVLGFTLSWKRALGAGILQVVRTRRLAGGLVAAVFERLLGMGEQGAPGGRDGRLAQAVTRLPLNEAAKRLRFAVIHQVRAAPQGGGMRGFLRRKIEARLLGAIERLTLARFRDEMNATGGIDLVKVRDELASAADALIADQIEGALLKATLLLSATAVLVSVGAAFGIQRIPFG
jgi:hypothetical protein